MQKETNISQIVTLPYPLLLQKNARDALDISLKGHVVIIDEAHNLMDAISSIHSTIVTLNQLNLARSQVGIYLQKFRNKLKGKNRVYLTQLVRFIDSLLAYLNEKSKLPKITDGIVTLGELMAGKGVDQINLYKLDYYLKESKLARKVDGYMNLFVETGTDKPRASTTPVLIQVQGFLQSLTNPASEGRFFFSRTENNDICLKYMLLDPAYHFKEVIEEARAVILAGGTMSPVRPYSSNQWLWLISRIR